MQTMTKLQKKLARLSACQEARGWVAEQSLETAWGKCERPAWLLWLAHKAKIDKKLIVKCACLCARTSLKYIKKGENRPKIAIETAERWVDGEATAQECRDAADAAYAAADAAYAAAHAAADAAYAAADAAYAAADAAYAAARAADAAYAAADAAYAAAHAARAADAAYAAARAADAAYAAADAAYAARIRANNKMCRLIRSVIPASMVLEALGGNL